MITKYISLDLLKFCNNNKKYSFFVKYLLYYDKMHDLIEYFYE